MPKKNTYGCLPFSASDFEKSIVAPSVFVMVNRGGGCNNPTKVKHIQELGG